MKGSVGPSDFGTLALAFDAKALPTVFLEPFGLSCCCSTCLCVPCVVCFVLGSHSCEVAILPPLWSYWGVLEVCGSFQDT